MRSARVACVALLAVVSACAPPPAAVTTPAAPQYPNFVFPATPEGTPRATVDRLAHGWRLLQANDVSAAGREFSAVLAANKNFAPARAATGYAALAANRASDAVTEFDLASPAERPYAPALVGRGLALLALTREEEALASFEAALAADAAIPELAERVATLRVRVVQDRIGRAERAAAAGRWDDARAAYRAAIAASPDAAFLYRDLAGVERRAGRPETALELAKAALVYDAEDARAHLIIGDVLAERREFDAALAAYRRAAAIEPSPALDATIATVRERARDAALPSQYRAIPDRSQASRGDLAALMGVRLAAALARTPQRQVVLTDVRGHWAEPWIQAVARSGAMEVYPNYTFQPDAPLRRLGLADAVSRALGALRPATLATWDGAPLVVSDVPTDHLAYPAVRRAVAAGVLRLEGGAFDLLGPVTGADVMDVVARLAALAGGRR